MMKNDSCNCIVKESFIKPENRNVILKQTIKKSNTYVKYHIL